MSSDDYDQIQPPSNSPVEIRAVEIPADSISADALEGIIDNFVTREGTDYGASEIGHDSKVERVRKQLARGDIKIVFDPDSESVNLMTKSDWIKHQIKVKSPQNS